MPPLVLGEEENAASCESFQAHGVKTNRQGMRLANIAKVYGPTGFEFVRRQPILRGAIEDAGQHLAADGHDSRMLD